MTATQAKKNDHFFIRFISNGEVREPRLIKWRSFKDVKKEAIESLKKVLESNHGRGDYTVEVLAAVMVDRTTAEEKRVGFPPRWEWEPGIKLFSL